ncbi:MAG: hypothetical protein ACPLXL_00665 [Minisyncoccia bacterium]
MFNPSDLESLKVKPISAPWPKGLLIFFVILFILVLGINFLLKFYLLNQEREINGLQTQLESVRASLDKEKEEEILRLEKKIDKLSFLLNNHLAFSIFFNWLEKYTHPDIYYLGLDYSLDNQKVTLEGIAKNNLALAEGVEAGVINKMINSTQLVEGVALKNLELENVEKTKFSLDIYLKSSGLLFKPESTSAESLNY